MLELKTAFEQLASQAAECRLCPRLQDRRAVLSHLNGTLHPLVMFIGEAPGQKGADRTRIPLVGDISGRNFDLFLTATGLSRQEIFITNAVLCNPREDDCNVRPNNQEIKNCKPFLLRQIELLQPPIIATLGAVALSSLKQIEPHKLTLKDVGKAFDWYGRKLVPLYHPSPHVVNGHRRANEQLLDYKVIVDILMTTNNSSGNSAENRENNTKHIEVL
ncbi:MAG: uracil-DNA glycosylase [Acidobacteria bacterium]|nr:uracil-DNA glycosylase [Acidobacteriota bacterium]